MNVSTEINDDQNFTKNDEKVNIWGRFSINCSASVLVSCKRQRDMQLMVVQRSDVYGDPTAYGMR